MYTCLYIYCTEYIYICNFPVLAQTHVYEITANLYCISPYMIICVFPPKISPKEKHTKSLFLHSFSHLLVAGPGLGSMSSESVTWISAAKQEGACPTNAGETASGNGLF